MTQFSTSSGGPREPERRRQGAGPGLDIHHTADDLTVDADAGVLASHLIHRLAQHTDPLARLAAPVTIRFRLGLAAAHDALTEDIAAHLDLDAGVADVFDRAERDNAETAPEAAPSKPDEAQ
jgi:hypothetical protein